MKSINRFITRIQDADDTNLTLTNGYMMVYDSGQGKFVMQAIPSTSPGGNSGQVQYNNGSGFAGHGGLTYNGAGIVTVSTAIVSPDIRPTSNAVNSTGFSKADGTRVLSVDTTNNLVGINTTVPSYPLTVVRSDDGVLISFRAKGGNYAGFQFSLADGTVANTNTFNKAGMYFVADGSGYGRGKIYFVNNNVASLANATTSDAVLVIDREGKVGIVNTSPTAWLHLPASTTSYASLRIGSGTTPTSPNDGDIWYNGTDFYLRSTNSYSVGSVVRTTAIRPVSDSTTALQFQNASGAAIVAVDTVNRLTTFYGYSSTASAATILTLEATGNASVGSGLQIAFRDEYISGTVGPIAYLQLTQRFNDSQNYKVAWLVSQGGTPVEVWSIAGATVSQSNTKMTASSSFAIPCTLVGASGQADRKSTRLNSSH